MSRRLINRENVVAASLVGTVVVLLGYASGFGLRPIFGETPAAAGSAPATRQPPVAIEQPPPTTTTTNPPGTGGAPRQVVPHAAVTYTGTPIPTEAVPAHAAPSPPAGPDPTQPGTTTPVPPCQPGLVAGTLDTVLSAVGEATAALGLPEVTVPLPGIAAAGPLAPMLGTCPPPTTTETAAPPR